MQEREPVFELPVEESLLPVIFPISKEACFEAGMFAAGLYGRQEAAQKLLQQEANIGKTRDAFAAVISAIEGANDEGSEKVLDAHTFTLGVLYSGKAISIHTKEKKVEIPTVHSMDVRSLMAKAGNYVEEQDAEILGEHSRAVSSIIENSYFATQKMKENEVKSFQTGARLFASCIAEVALKTPPDFKSRVVPQKSAFDLKPSPFTKEEFEAILKKIAEEEEK